MLKIQHSISLYSFQIICQSAEKSSIDLVLALGKPKETVELVDVSASGSTAYSRDENGIHYVPKHSVNNLIVK